MGGQAGLHFAGGVAVGVAEACRGDGVIGRYGVDKRARRRAFAAVVSQHQHLRAQGVAVAAYQFGLAARVQVARYQHCRFPRQHAQHAALAVVTRAARARVQKLEAHAVPFPRFFFAAALRLRVKPGLSGQHGTRAQGGCNQRRAAVVVGIVVRQKQHVRPPHAERAQGGQGLHLRRAFRARVEQKDVGGRLKIHRQALSDIDHDGFQTALFGRRGAVEDKARQHQRSPRPQARAARQQPHAGRRSRQRGQRPRRSGHAPFGRVSRQPSQCLQSLFAQP